MLLCRSAILDGAEAAPQEDSGGPHGFADMRQRPAPLKTADAATPGAGKGKSTRGQAGTGDDGIDQSRPHTSQPCGAGNPRPSWRLRTTYDDGRIIRMQKLTLSVDERVVARAKRYARTRGTSVSRLVETMLDLVAAPAADRADDAPVLTRLRGSMKRASLADYRRYLQRKYR